MGGLHDEDVLLEPLYAFEPRHFGGGLFKLRLWCCGRAFIFIYGAGAGIFKAFLGISWHQVPSHLPLSCRGHVGETAEGADLGRLASALTHQEAINRLAGCAVAQHQLRSCPSDHVPRISSDFGSW